MPWWIRLAAIVFLVMAGAIWARVSEGPGWLEQGSEKRAMIKESRARVEACVDMKKKLAPGLFVSDELEARFTDECIKSEQGAP